MNFPIPDISAGGRKKQPAVVLPGTLHQRVSFSRKAVSFQKLEAVRTETVGHTYYTDIRLAERSYGRKSPLVGDGRPTFQPCPRSGGRDRQAGTARKRPARRRGGADRRDRRETWPSGG